MKSISPALSYLPEEAPIWFHGSMERNIAEQLLLTSDHCFAGLYLVRQSVNRIGRFVISVYTGEHVNHYIIEKLESMFYVKREKSLCRGQEFQARDLPNLLHCYENHPLDDSGLRLRKPLEREIELKTSVTMTAKSDSEKKNHNYIPLYAYDCRATATECYVADDFDKLSFYRGEKLTLLLRENREWWYGFNENNEIGYIPTKFVQKFHQSEKLETVGGFNPCTEVLRKEIIQHTERHVNRIINNTNNSVFTEEMPTHIVIEQLDFLIDGRTKTGSSKNNDIYVSSEYISNFLQKSEHKRLEKINKLYQQKIKKTINEQECCNSRNGERSREIAVYPTFIIPPEIKRDLKPRKHKPLPLTPDEINKNYQNIGFAQLNCKQIKKNENID